MILEALVGTSILLQGLGARQQRKSGKLDLQTRLLAARKERVQAVKEARAAQAVTAVQAAAYGATDSSAVLGATASTASQFGANMGLSLAIDAFGRKQAKYNQNAVDLGVAAGAFGTLASLAKPSAVKATAPAGESVPTPAGTTVGFSDEDVQAFRKQFVSSP